MSQLLDERSLCSLCYGKGQKSESTRGFRISSVENRLGVRKSIIVRSIVSDLFLTKAPFEGLLIEEGFAGWITKIFDGINENVFEGKTANVVLSVGKETNCFTSLLEMF